MDIKATLIGDVGHDRSGGGTDSEYPFTELLIWH